MVTKNKEDYIYNIKFYKTISAIILGLLFLLIILLIPAYYYSASALVLFAMMLLIIMMAVAFCYTYYRYIGEVVSYDGFRAKFLRDKDRL